MDEEDGMVLAGASLGIAMLVIWIIFIVALGIRGAG
jgi:hypothetical protein